MDLLIEKIADIAREYNANVGWSYNSKELVMEFYFNSPNNLIRFKYSVDCFEFSQCLFVHLFIEQVEKEIREKLEAMGW